MPSITILFCLLPSEPPTVANSTYLSHMYTLPLLFRQLNLHASPHTYHVYFIILLPNSAFFQTFSRHSGRYYFPPTPSTYIPIRSPLVELGQFAVWFYLCLPIPPDIVLHHLFLFNFTFPDHYKHSFYY